jgi:hypothetical protein
MMKARSTESTEELSKLKNDHLQGWEAIFEDAQTF